MKHGQLVRLMIRGYVGRTVIFEERVDVPFPDLGTILPTLAEQHASKLAAYDLHMIEIEFLDEPNEQGRYFRFGTDPAGMVMPIEVPLGGRSSNG